MPDKYQPGWLIDENGSLEDYDIISKDFSYYTVHISKGEKSVIYDDIELKYIDSDIVVSLQVPNEDEPDVYLTLDVSMFDSNKTYKSIEFIEDSDGCGIIRLRDQDTAVCEFCDKEIPTGSRILALTGGLESASVHCSCWSEMVDTVSEFIEQNHDTTLSQII